MVNEQKFMARIRDTVVIIIIIIIIIIILPS